MIEIRNEAGVSLHLTPGQKLTTELTADWLADNELPGGFSYPINFPLDAQNERFLRGGYRPNQADVRMDIPVSVRIEGMLYRRCVLSYRVNEGRGDGFLKIDSGEVYDQLRKLTLRELLTETFSNGLYTIQVYMRMLAEAPPGQYPFTFFPIRNEGFWEKELTPEQVPGFVRQPYVNAWGPGLVGMPGFLTDSLTTKGYPVAPQFYVSYILEKIFSYAGYSITGDWPGHPETARLVVINQTAATQLSPAGTLMLSIRAGDHVPDLSVSEFLKAMRGRYGLGFIFDSQTRTVAIRRYVDVARSAGRQDLTPYLAGRYGIDAPNTAGITLVDYLDPADELEKDSVGTTRPAPRYVQGAGGQTVELKCGTIQAGTAASGNGVLNGRWLVPVLRQAGNTLDPSYAKSERYPGAGKDGQLDTPKNAIGCRIVSYRGLQPDTQGINYPLATPDVRTAGQVVIGDRSAKLGGPTGVWATSLQPYWAFRDQTRPVRIPLRLPLPVLAGLRLDEPVVVALEDQMRSRYLIQKIQAEAPGVSGFVRCRLECLTLPSESVGDPFEIGIWAELVVTPLSSINYQETFKEGGFLKTKKTYYWTRIRRKVEVKLWADAQKTRPADVAGISVTVLRQDYQKPFPPGPGPMPPVELAAEMWQTLVVRGSGGVVEADLLAQDFVAGDLTRPYVFEISYSLAPGDEYLLI